MNQQRASIDPIKLAFYILKRIWLVVICAAIGFGVMYTRSTKRPNTYTTYGTMFVTNSNPNLVNYGYASSSDFYNAVALVKVYSEVIKSESVMQRVLEYPTPLVQEDGTEKEILLSQKYPGLSTAYVRGTISMLSVNETPLVRVVCTTNNPEKTLDICNAVLQVAPAALKDVVGAGDTKPQDYPNLPTSPNPRNDLRQGLMGAAVGAAGAAALLAGLFLLNSRVEDTKELTESYHLPILSMIKRSKGESENPSGFLLNDKSEMDLVESYAKLRMNVFYTLVGKERHTVLMTSAISGEGKSTIAANLAISMAMSGKRVLLIDADMRRACQSDVFRYDHKAKGLSDVLIGSDDAESVIIRSVRENLDVLPAGTTPPNPSELLESREMQSLLSAMEGEYDLVLLDAPPINIVSDPLALSSQMAGALFVVRQHFSDHREIRRALNAAEMTGMNLLGFIFYGEKLRQGSYYSRKYYRGYYYYHKYDTRSQSRGDVGSGRNGPAGSPEFPGIKRPYREDASDLPETTKQCEPLIYETQDNQETARSVDDNEEAQETDNGAAPTADGDLHHRRRRSGRYS